MPVSTSTFVPIITVYCKMIWSLFSTCDPEGAVRGSLLTMMLRGFEMLTEWTGAGALDTEASVEILGLGSVLDRLRPLTMFPRECLVDLAWQVRACLEENLPGAFVECGVWRGGTSFFMAHLLREA